jgi:PBSX family phage terminase large subunit
MIKDFIINDAYLDAMAVSLHPKCRLFVFEGSIRSQKTVTAIQAFFEAVQDSNERLHLIAAQDLDAVRDNILQSDFGLEICYPKYTSREKEEFGGYYLKVKCDIPGKPEVKRVLLCGFAMASHWKKILGKTLGVILIDEANNAHEQFIDECFARQTSADNPKMLWTLNGDVPSHYIYQKYINRCFIIGDAPASIRADMDKFPKEGGWYYRHWKMEDNPIMTLEKIERAKSIYPVGSYYYKIKILGERGAPGKMLYLEYMDPNRHIKPLDVRNYHYFGIGFDIGATRAYNSISLWGFRNDYTKIGMIDKMTFKQCGYNEKTKHLISFIKRYRHLNIRYVSIDSAELNYIQDMKALFSVEFPDIEVIASYKATIKQRVDLGIIMFSHDQIEFNDTSEGRDAYDAFMVAKRSEKPNEVREDNNERHNDIIDSSEYAWTPQMNKILLAAKKYEQGAA